MEGTKIILTPEGKEKRENELKYLKETWRVEIAKKIQEAREQGDLSENAEYDAAMDEQGKVEAHIKELEEILRNAEVQTGFIVDVRLVELDKEFRLSVVGALEVDSQHGKISNESPLAIALVGKEPGDVVEVEAPGGTFHYEIIGFPDMLSEE